MGAVRAACAFACVRVLARAYGAHLNASQLCEGGIHEHHALSAAE